MSDEREPFIEAYFKAFRRANPGEAVPSIWYSGFGWYGMNDGGAHKLSYRKGDLEAMTERLVKRSAVQSHD